MNRPSSYPYRLVIAIWTTALAAMWFAMPVLVRWVS